jgi:hypothetical protein
MLVLLSRVRRPHVCRGPTPSYREDQVMGSLYLAVERRYSKLGKRPSWRSKDQRSQQKCERS